ncbi:hypothetical protein HJB79_18060 [Rhizobium lentis]|uniref:hypothetical protein n=1 Tax=Rhizobium lentis TaxID=1138194 RepID=UPI001C82B98A|nr:hypothetical protein [Rhizobium lentis]MBX5140660.1 hypothetical protein [Rhizobium lentis]
MKTPQQRIEARRLVFLDEAWINTNMAPRWAWGRRLCATVPHEHWKILTFIAALRPDLVHRCPDGELFTLHFERILVPTHAKGDIVIMDNLGSHKDQAVHRRPGCRRAPKQASTL